MRTKQLFLTLALLCAVVQGAWAQSDIEIDDNADNGTTISTAKGQAANVTLQGRTLYKDGDWNTLCLPFSLASFTGTPLEGATVKTLASSSFSGGTLTLNFTEDVTRIEAGKPYIVKWNPVDLFTLTDDYTAKDGEVLTGTLIGNYKISIAAGAKVKLQNVTINGTHNENYKWAGISCEGDATIILSGTNTVRGFHYNYPGIHVPKNCTLTITGSGSLNASTSDFGAGIGAGSEIPCGNIVIKGGIITATGGGNSAGIGGSYLATCGYITITDGVTSVTATKGEDAPYSIGAGNDSSCGTVTIECADGEIISGVTYKGKGTVSVDDVTNIENPVFNSVTISNTTANVSTTYVDFIGTYSPVNIYTAEKTNLYLGTDNTLYYPNTEGYEIKACRAYFQLKNGLTAGNPAGVRVFKLNFGEDDETTGILSLTPDPSPIGEESEYWYTLDGRKLSGKPTQRGIYVRSASGSLQGKNNGRKFIIK